MYKLAIFLAAISLAQANPPLAVSSISRIDSNGPAVAVVQQAAPAAVIATGAVATPAVVAAQPVVAVRQVVPTLISGANLVNLGGLGLGGLTVVNTVPTVISSGIVGPSTAVVSDGVSPGAIVSANGLAAPASVSTAAIASPVAVVANTLTGAKIVG